MPPWLVGFDRVPAAGMRWSAAPSWSCWWRWLTEWGVGTGGEGARGGVKKEEEEAEQHGNGSGAGKEEKEEEAVEEEVAEDGQEGPCAERPMRRRWR